MLAEVLLAANIMLTSLLGASKLATTIWNDKTGRC